MMAKYVLKKRLSIVFILVIFMSSVVLARDDQSKTDDDQRLREEILKVYESHGEIGVRNFVKERRSEITLSLIFEIAYSGFNKKNEQWLKISMILAEEKKNEKTVELWFALAKVLNYLDISTILNDYNLYASIYIFAQFGICQCIRSMERSFECLEKLIPLIEKIDHPFAHEVLILLKTSIYAFKNDMNKMEPVFDKELKSIKETENLQQQGPMFLAKGAIYLNNGEYIRSLEILEKALKLFQEAGDVYGQGYVYMVWGTLYKFIGDNIRACDMFDKALFFFEKEGFLPAQCRVYRMKAVIYQNIEEDLKAIVMYDKALDSIETREYNQEKGEIYFAKGHLYRKAGDGLKAREMYNHALDLFEKDRDITGRRSVYEAKGTISLISSGNYSDAIDIYENAVPFYTEFGHRGKGHLYKTIGEIHFFIGNYAKAAAMYDQALQECRKTGTSQLLSHSLHRKAQALEKLGKKEEALNFFEEAIEKLEEIYRQKGIPWMKMILMERLFNQFEEAVVFMLENEYYDKGFKYLDSMKARVFLDQLAEGLVKMEKGIDRELLQKRYTLISKLSLLSKAISETNQKEDKKKLEKLKDEYHETENEFEDLLVRIRLENPLYASVQYPEPITVDELQKDFLKRKEVLIQYFITGEKVYVFLVSKKDFQVVTLEITKEYVNKMVEEYLKPFKEKIYQRKRNIPIVRRWMNIQGKIFYESLFKPLESKLRGEKNIIIVPDDKLSTIPFESFVIDDTNPGKPVYLLEKYRMKYIQSASVLATLRKHYSRKRKTNHFIGFGDPVYDYGNFKQEKPERGAPDPAKGDEITGIHRGKYEREGGQWVRLKDSGEEVKTIAGLFSKNAQKAVVHLREKANEENAKAVDMKTFDYIHFSCHGILGDGFQGLVLSQISGAKEDGYLTRNEIMNCDYNAKLVVLSACRTGKGKMERSEGVTGLTRAVMYAGTPAAVVSLWNVSEKGTKELMVKFYKNMLEKGMSKEEALRMAKLEMIESRKYSSPYFWSAFVMYGE